MGYHDDVMDSKANLGLNKGVKGRAVATTLNHNTIYATRIPMRYPATTRVIHLNNYGIPMVNNGKRVSRKRLLLHKLFRSVVLCESWVVAKLIKGHNAFITYAAGLNEDR